ncbi:site-specific integrase [Burkholderia pseudomallei]|uniref:site-specific integrase n=1 Tax=Burkholderia pseudomallei TaxID=28450 RepID=UPI001604F965|nr:site-specific integrase [Burkholderia pseudomallei]
MTNHLLKRGTRYYIRRKIPIDLISHYRGRKEIVKALGTSEPAKARERVREESYRLDQEFAALRQQPAESPQTVELREFVLDPATSESVPSGRSVRLDPRRPGSYGLATYDGEQVAVLWPKDVDDAYHKQRLKHARAFAHGVLIARATGPGHTPSAHEVTQIEAPESCGGVSAGHLAALVEKWAKEREPASRTVRKAELIVERFYTHVGRIPVARIARAHAILFKDKLLESGQTPVNTNKQLELFGTLLNYARDNMLATENVAHRIRVQVKGAARGKTRVSFDLPALTAIFASPVYTEGARPAGGAGEAAYWLPLLGLFTGARLEELAQLRPEDIYTDSYHGTDGTSRPCTVLRITDAGERQGVKNAGSVRRIPIHVELLARGFVEYAHSQRGNSRIFSALVANKHGEESAQWSKWFGKYLRGVCKVTDKRMVYHSFRHGFKDMCRECGISKEIADALQGHSDGDASSNYGAEFYPLRPLVDAIDRYKIHGLELPGRA